MPYFVILKTSKITHHFLFVIRYISGKNVVKIWSVVLM